ncbi:hypothetical protein OLX02_16480 [Novosphingobium sp. KCTC 2891]|nr:hypothetical protein [Novosphingobium sp. KCTC 2891]
MTEQITRLMDSTFDRRDIHHTFDNLEHAIELFKQVRDNTFFEGFISQVRYKDRHGREEIFSNALDSTINKSRNYIAANRPPKVAPSRASETVQSFGSASLPATNDDPWQRLDEITPAQQSGPLQFEFRSGVLYVKPQTSQARQLDLDSILKARASLGRDASELVATLQETNVDRRLIEVVSEVEQVITSGADVIRLGLINFTCEQLFSKFADQLPDVAAARFLGFSTGIGLYVGQFPEWHRFIENAASANFEKSDMEVAYDVGRSLLPALRDAKGLVDPEVPKSIELILEALRNPKLSAKRVLYGAVKTLENLLATVFKEVSGLLRATSDGVQGGIKKAATALVATGLLYAAAHTAVQLSPTAERVANANWLKMAGDIVKSALSE